MLINLTPHPVVLLGADGRVTLPKCENPPRLSEVVTETGETAEGIAIVEKSFDGTGCFLSEPVLSILYVVPLAIAQAFARERDDLLVPDDLVRDEQGRILGCRRLARIVE